MKLQHLILEKIAEIGGGVVESFFPATYPEARVWRELLKLEPSHQFSKGSFSAILSRLRKEGFIEKKNDSRKNAIWKITKKGSNYIKKETHRDTIPSPIKDGITRIISYDIPEKEAGKRRKVRAMLLGLEYEQLHKSVWIGFSPLPADFFTNLDTLELKDYIHIFSINKKGTLDKIRT